jgi:membrane-associated protease RseP (regulator of RpoE activity)
MSVLLFILGVVLIALGVFVSVVLHEFGHFIPAKLFGARVPQFFFGAGRTLWSFRRGETEFGIKAIPLMGYVQIVGMVPPKPSDPAGTVPTASTSLFGSMIEGTREVDHEAVRPGDEHRLFYKLPVWKRVVIMLGGPAVNLVLGTILITTVVMGFGTVQPTTTIQAVSECMKVATASSTASAAQTACTPQDAKTPALQAGLKPGDRLVSFNGTPTSSWAEAQTAIRTAAGQTVSVVVERGGTDVTLSVTPIKTARPELDAFGRAATDASGTIKTTEVGFIGVAPAQEMTPGTLGDSLAMTRQNITSVANVVLHLPQRLYQVGKVAFGLEERDPNGPMSVVGVGRIGGEITADQQIPWASKIASVLAILGGLNIALFVFNLIPLTPLDGGNVVAALWDGIRKTWARLRGKPEPAPFDTAKLAPLSATVFTLFAAMSVLLIFVDLVHPISLN